MRKLPRYNHKHRKFKHNYSNTILSKSITSNLIFEQNTFFNVNFRGSRLRKNRFRYCSFVLCDFYGVILNKSRFENAFFRKCVFYATIFRNCKFVNCKFDNCVFINMSYDFEGDSELNNCKKYSYYDLSIAKEAQEDFQVYKPLEVFQKNRLLYIKGGKINKSTLFIALQFFTYNDFKERLDLAYKSNSIKNIFSTFQLIEVLQRQKL